jgi:hypothetical protein
VFGYLHLASSLKRNRAKLNIGILLQAGYWEFHIDKQLLKFTRKKIAIHKSVSVVCKRSDHHHEIVHTDGNAHLCSRKPLRLHFASYQLDQLY